MDHRSHSPAIHRLVASVETVEALDLLLHVRSLKGRPVTARALAASGVASTAAAEHYLAKLCARGYLAVEIGMELHYSYRPIDMATRQAVDELDAEIALRRPEIVALFDITARVALIAEDDSDMREILRVSLENRGFRTKAMRHGHHAMVTAETENLALAVVSVRSALTNGLALLRALRERARPVPTIVMTSFSDARLRGSIDEIGVTHVLEKPFELDDFERVVNLSRSATHPASVATSNR
jgi:ActR/RegA family two-component response regulator